MKDKKLNDKGSIEISNRFLGSAKVEDINNQVFRRPATAGFYSNIEPGISIRPPFDQNQRDYYRGNEIIPKGNDQKSLRMVMALCIAAYNKVGVIKSVVDLMSEFTAEGIKIVHPDEGPNKFYKNWQKRVNLPDRAERFANYFYKAGNLVGKRKNGSFDVGGQKYTVPLQYVFYNPATIEVLGGDAAVYSDYKRYGVRVPISILLKLKESPEGSSERKLYDGLDKDIKKALEDNKHGHNILIPISESDFFIAHYKKDDTDLWARSFIYSVLEDVLYNDKLKLAKMSALDGWYNVFRIWKLGDTANNIYPSPDMFAKLSSILEQNTGGGAVDLLWRDDIEVQELYPPVEKLLNYDENIDAILIGLGVPQGFIGGKAKGSDGMTTSMLGLKNFIKRLESGRRALVEWLEGEIDIIQKAMGFRVRPEIQFSYTDLHDERTYFNLLLQLVDRNILSDETILERIHEFPDVERARLMREQQKRESGVLPDKVSPLIQEPELLNPADIPNNGRPPGSKDTVKRKRGPNRKDKNNAHFMVEASRLYDITNSYLNSMAIKTFGVANLRQLNNKQEQTLRDAKLQLFAKLVPFDAISIENIEDYLDNTDAPISEIYDIFNEGIQQFGGVELKNEDMKLIAINAYIEAWSKY